MNQINESDYKRFLKYVKVEGQCFNWTGTAQERGYGKITLWKNKKHITISSHRFIWTYLIGLIPQGLFVCHKCDNPKCVRPDHLFLDTHNGNMQDSVRKNRQRNIRKTHCSKGHEYSEDNLIIEKYKGGRFQRRCRVCKNKNSIKSWYKNAHSN